MGDVGCSPRIAEEAVEFGWIYPLYLLVSTEGGCREGQTRRFVWVLGSFTDAFVCLREAVGSGADCTIGQ